MPSDRLIRELLTKIDGASRAAVRLGTVDAIDLADGSLTVDLAGELVPGMRWVGSYSPVVGDFVVVSRADTQWVVLGKLSKQLGSPSLVYGEVTRIPDSVASVTRWPDLTWGVGSAWEVFTQGRSSAGADNGAAWWYPPLPTMVPDGATITGAKLRLTRIENWEGNSGVALVKPRIYSHAMAPNLVPGTGPVWVDGPWAPGDLAIGDSVVWDLPSAWVTAWAAGTVKGFGVFSDKVADWMVFGQSPSNLWPATITVTYTVPS